MSAVLLAPPLAWFGGKAQAVAWYLQYLPPHHTYVEVFGGMAAVLFAKAPAPVEVYNDLDQGLVEFFRVLRDPVACAQLEARLALTPYSRAEFLLCRATWQTCEAPIERAARWVVQVRQSFSATPDGSSGWSFCVTESARGRAKSVAGWQRTLDALLPCGTRLLQVQIECAAWSQILRTYDTPQTLFFCDPPYLPSTRQSGGYAQELTEGAHLELLRALRQVQGMVLLCGYPHASYLALAEDGWTCVQRETVASALRQARPPRTECLWMNAAARQGIRQLELFGARRKGKGERRKDEG